MILPKFSDPASIVFLHKHGIFYDKRKHPFWGHEQFRPFIWVKDQENLETFIPHYILTAKCGFTDEGQYHKINTDPVNLFRSEKSAWEDIFAFVKKRPLSGGEGAGG